MDHPEAGQATDIARFQQYSGYQTGIANMEFLNGEIYFSGDYSRAAISAESGIWKVSCN